MTGCTGARRPCVIEADARPARSHMAAVAVGARRHMAHRLRRRDSTIVAVAALRGQGREHTVGMAGVAGQPLVRAFERETRRHVIKLAIHLNLVVLGIGRRGQNREYKQGCSHKAAKVHNPEQRESGQSARHTSCRAARDSAQDSHRRPASTQPTDHAIGDPEFNARGRTTGPFARRNE